MSDKPILSPEHLRVLCDAMVELVRIRAANCPHVAVENLAPEILQKLIGAVKTRAPVNDPVRSVTNEEFIRMLRGDGHP